MACNMVAGGGSTLSFDFSSNENIVLNSYTLSSSGFFLGNPLFHIQQGASVLSANNTSNSSGDTHVFNGGPLLLNGGTTYTFQTQTGTTGAGVQAFMASWDYSVAVPEPSGIMTLGAFSLLLIRRRRMRLAR